MKYEDPVMEIEFLECSDVITLSGGDSGSGGTEDGSGMFA